MVETESILQLRIVLVAPPAGVSFGIQDGKGTKETTVAVQQSSGPMSCSPSR